MLPGSEALLLVQLLSELVICAVLILGSLCVAAVRCLGLSWHEIIPRATLSATWVPTVRADRHHLDGKPESTGTVLHLQRL